MHEFPHAIIMMYSKLKSQIDALLAKNPRLLIASSVALLLVLHTVARRRGVRHRRYVTDLAILEGGEWDYVIIGGGTAGCALAARLSEDPSIRVLVLESGGSGAALAESTTPIRYGALFFSKHSFHYRTEPQHAAGGHQRVWPRAKLLGGCSSINAQMAQYGAPGDFGEWAKYTGDDSWASKNFTKYFKKFENYRPHPSPSKTLHPTSHPDPSIHGTAGPVHVGFFNNVTKTGARFIQSCIRVGIPQTADFNAFIGGGVGGSCGVTRVMTYIDSKYKRVSSETAYFTPDVLARENLTVAIHATTLRILFDDVTKNAAQSHHKPRATGVEYAQQEGGNVFRVHAKREVVLCAGAINSPHILLLSGVGPKAQLQKHNIPVIYDLPGVGQRLVDHPVVDLYFKDKSGDSIRFLTRPRIPDILRTIGALVRYNIGKGGPLATNIGEAAAFVRSDDPSLFPPSEYSEKLLDSSSGPDSPDLELFTTPIAYKEQGLVGFYEDTVSLHCYLLRPTSHGSVQLKSANPWEGPSMNPNYVTTHEDLEKLLRGVRLCLRISQTSPFSEWLDPDYKENKKFDHQLHLLNDDDLREVVKKRVETVYHPTSTCRMGPVGGGKGEEGNVVDPQLRVFGVNGLRICDASIFPFIVSGHTAGACYAIAEKLADEIKSELRMSK